MQSLPIRQALCVAPCMACCCCKPLGLSKRRLAAGEVAVAQKKPGTGTLDPAGHGVLPLCFGAATKFSQLHLDADKVTRQLPCWTTTRTGDAEGEVVGAPRSKSRSQT